MEVNLTMHCMKLCPINQFHLNEPTFNSKVDKLREKVVSCPITKFSSINAAMLYGVINGSLKLKRVYPSASMNGTTL